MSKSPAATPEITWQEAVARLVRERTLAKTGAQLLKKYGSAADVAAGSVRYGEAKAEYDAIIAGLVVALARQAAPDSLPDLLARFTRGFDKREEFCRRVYELLPVPDAGEKGWIGDAITGGVGPVLDAIEAIWFRTRDENLLLRETIKTQLEMAIWPGFAAVSPDQ